MKVASTNNTLIERLDRSEKTMYIIAGCNGAGKTTAFRRGLYESLGCPEFINSDEIAHDLCPDDVESVQTQAGRLAVEKIHAHLAGDKSFCVETTLATRTYRGYIEEAHRNGFKVSLFYYRLESPEQAVARVKQRVKEGGHNVPEETVRIRYRKSIEYLDSLYLPIVDSWAIVDNGGMSIKLNDFNDIYATGAKNFTESLLKSKAEKGETVVYSINGQVVTLKASDALWIYESLARGLGEWEIKYLKEKAAKREDMCYRLAGAQTLVIPALLVLDLFEWISDSTGA